MLYDKYRGTVQRYLAIVGEEEATRITLGGYVKVISVSLGEGDDDEPSFEVEVVHGAQATGACSRVGRDHAVAAIDDLGKWLTVDLAAGLGPDQQAAVEACVARHIAGLRTKFVACALAHGNSERDRSGHDPAVILRDITLSESGIVRRAGFPVVSLFLSCALRDYHPPPPLCAAQAFP